MASVAFAHFQHNQDFNPIEKGRSR